MSDAEADDNAAAAAMAAAMGFSAFGAQARPSKKRRFNPRADAAADLLPRPATSSSTPAPTASNATPLGTRRTPSNLPLHPRSPDEAISLTEDDDDDDEGDQAAQGAQYLDTSRAPSQGHGQGQGGDAVDPEDEAALQAKIDAVVAAGNAAYGLQAQAAPQLDGSCISHDRGFRPSVVAGAANAGKGSISGSGGYFHGRGGGRGWGGGGGSRGGHSHGGGEGQREWWVDYYDPSSNQNPWERLEQSLGLEARGSWLPKGGAKAEAG